MNRLTLQLLVSTALMSSACTPGPPTLEDRLRFESCGFDGVETEVECGWFDVYEDREAASGRLISLYFVRGKASGPNPQPDPIFLLSGGPGGGATGNVSGLLNLWQERLKERDIVFVDQRGTGSSSPLDCFSYSGDDDPSAFRELVERDFFDLDLYRSCLERLRSRADLTKYTTSIVADDIDELRAALGYDQINLSGGSYGTRLGLEYIRRHGPTVRSAVLLGVAPSFAFLAETVARDLEDSVEALIQACSDDDACPRDYPNFEEQLAEVLERVAREPISLELENPSSGELETFEIRYPQLVTALRYALYSVQISASLPARVQAATDGEFGPLVENVPQLLAQLANALAEGMWASVKCSEEVRFLDLDHARALSADTILGTLRLDAEVEICSIWPKAEIPSDFHQPVTSDVPVLLIAGEVDPASPLRLAEQAAETLSNSTLVKVANRSHWGLRGEECVEGIVNAFLRSASGDGIDLHCAAELERPAFTEY